MKKELYSVTWYDTTKKQWMSETNLTKSNAMAAQKAFSKMKNRARVKFNKQV